MKTNTLRTCSAVVKLVSILTGLASYVHMLPEKWSSIAVMVFMVASATKDYAISIGDVADDGKKNQSFNP